MRILLIGLLALVAACQTVGQSALVHPAPPVAANVRFDPDQLVEFVHRAFFIDGETDIGREVSSLRLDEPITVYFSGSGAEKMRPLAEYVLNELSQVTGVPFKAVNYLGNNQERQIVVKAEKLSSIRKLFVEYFGYEQRRGYCMMFPFYKRDRSTGLIAKAEVLVPANSEYVWAECFREEFAHAFGLQGDGEFGAPSAMGSGKVQTTYYTDWDRAALWIAYHPDLRPGMMWDEAEPIVRRIVAETWPKF